MTVQITHCEWEKAQGILYLHEELQAIKDC